MARGKRGENETADLRPDTTGKVRAVVVRYPPRRRAPTPAPHERRMIACATEMRCSATGLM